LQIIIFKNGITEGLEVGHCFLLSETRQIKPLHAHDLSYISISTNTPVGRSKASTIVITGPFRSA